MSSYTNMINQITKESYVSPTNNVPLNQKSGSSSIGNFSALNTGSLWGCCGGGGISGCGCGGYGSNYSSLEEWSKDACAASYNFSNANAYNVTNMAKAYSKANTISAKESIKTTWYSGVSNILGSSMNSLASVAGIGTTAISGNLLSSLFSGLGGATSSSST